MAPIKFEEHIKEKLDEREIQPSEGSWDKLEFSLKNSDKGLVKKWWISAVAAVGVLLIASILFIDTQDQNSIPIVATPLEKTVRDNSENNTSEKVILVTSEETKERIEPEIKPLNNKNPEPNRLSPKIIESNKAENLASNDPKERGLVEQVFISPLSEKQDLNSDYSGEISELLAKISEQEKKSGSITEAEVDVLLAEAAKKISEERNLHAQDKISAADLLADVEFEVDQSFRKEVFDFLKEEFLKAKTAVATRND